MSGLQLAQNSTGRQAAHCSVGNNWLKLDYHQRSVLMLVRGLEPFEVGRLIIIHLRQRAFTNSIIDGRPLWRKHG